jgi:hypothetical protein
MNIWSVQYSIAGNRYALVNVELLVLSRLLYRYHKLSVCSTSSRVTKLPVCVARVVRGSVEESARIRKYSQSRGRGALCYVSATNCMANSAII